MTDYTNLISDDLRVLEGNNNGGTPYDVLTLDIGEDDVSLFIKTKYGSSDGIPVEVWNGKVRRFELVRGACVIDRDALRKDLADSGKVAGLIDRIKEGLTVEWDGSNMRGLLNEDGVEAQEALDDMIYNDRLGYADDQWAVQDESEWVADLASSTIDAQATDEQIDAFLAECRASAPGDKVILTGDARGWLIKMRNDLKADLED